MSLIPLLLGRLSTTASTKMVLASATGPSRYDPGAGHRPFAAAIAVGLPAALLIAVALTPFEMPPIIEHEPTKIKTIPLPPPVPTPLDPVSDPVKQPKAVITAPTPPIPIPFPRWDGPISSSDPIEPTGPEVGTGPGKPEVILPLPPVPEFIAAKLDSRFERNFQPGYPPFEQRNDIEGTARVRVLVGTDGRVKAVEDAGASSPGFFTETRRHALAKWRFKPATRGGIAEESWFTITVKFQIES